MNEAATFSRWLKRLRASHDLTQEALAERIGCAAQTIRMYESGARRPSREIAERLADVLEVPAAERATFTRLARIRPTEATPDALPDSTATRSSPAGVTPTVQLRQPPRSSLPVPPTPLIGREHEQAEVLRLLDDPACRLVSLVGPGGVGKTRLAIQVAINLAARFRDGSVWVSLAPVTTAEVVASTIADSVGCALHGPSSAEDQLLLFLRERELLLVLDNFEHLLPASVLLSRIAVEAPNVRLLVTSRERLRLRVEWTVDLGGLQLPASNKDDAVIRSEAVMTEIPGSVWFGGEDGFGLLR